MSRIIGVLATAATAALLTACAATPAATTGETGSAGGEYPIVIDNAFGQTVIKSKPERVATVAYGNQEVPLALGVVPVGMSAVGWGDDDGDGILPWDEERLAELGGEAPVLFDDTDGIDFEAVANTQPDVILASYSGLTQEEYDTLSKIAPVVAYPDTAWGTTMDEMIRMNAAGMGMAAEGEQLVKDLATTAETEFAGYPDLAGKSMLFAWIEPTDFSQIGFYTARDPRAGYFYDLGMVEPAAVTEATAASEEFYAQVSAEQADSFSDVDVIVTYGGDGLLAAMQADPLLGKIPAIAEGRVVVLQDSTPLAAAANPTPGAIGWGLQQYLELLSGAVTS